MSTNNKTDDFSLKSNSDVFNSRLSSVFDNLNSLEENHESWRKTQDKVDNKRLWKEEPEEPECDKRTFKRPFNASRVCNNLQSRHSYKKNQQPGYEQNPTQWVKYSLADVSDYDLSDKSNTKAAISFLEMRKRQRLQDSQDTNDESLNEKPVFRKPFKQSHTEGTLNLEQVSTNPRAIVMPECVIGTPKARKIPIKHISATKATSSGNSVSLDHLHEGEDSEEDNNE